MGPHDHQYDYRNGQYYRNSFHPDGASNNPDYDNSGYRTSYHKSGMGWDPYFGASDASRQGSTSTTAPNSSNGFSAPSYASTSSSDDSASSAGGAVALIIFFGLAALFNDNEKDRSSQRQSRPPVSYVQSNQNYQPLKPQEKLKMIERNAMIDLFQNFMDYKNTEILFAQFKLQRYSDDNPVNPETGFAPLSPKDIKAAIHKVFYKEFPVSGYLDKKTFAEYYPIFSVELTSELAKYNATDDEIAIVRNLVDIHLIQKIADAVDAEFTPFEVPLELTMTQIKKEAQDEIQDNGLSSDFETAASENQNTASNSDPVMEAPQTGSENQIQSQQPSQPEMGIY